MDKDARGGAVGLHDEASRNVERIRSEAVRRREEDARREELHRTRPPYSAHLSSDAKKLIAEFIAEMRRLRVDPIPCVLFKDWTGRPLVLRSIVRHFFPPKSVTGKGRAPTIARGVWHRDLHFSAWAAGPIAVVTDGRVVWGRLQGPGNRHQFGTYEVIHKLAGHREAYMVFGTMQSLPLELSPDSAVESTEDSWGKTHYKSLRACLRSALEGHMLSREPGSSD